MLRPSLVLRARLRQRISNPLVKGSNLVSGQRDPRPDGALCPAWAARSGTDADATAWPPGLSQGRQGACVTGRLKKGLA